MFQSVEKSTIELLSNCLRNTTVFLLTDLSKNKVKSLRPVCWPSITSLTNKMHTNESSLDMAVSVDYNTVFHHTVDTLTSVSAII